MADYEHITQADETRLTEVWREEMVIPYECKDHRDEFLQSLSKIEDMWDGNPGRIRTRRHEIKLRHSDTRPIHSTSYRAGRIARQLCTKCSKKRSSSLLAHSGIVLSSLCLKRWFTMILRRIPQIQCGDGEIFILSAKGGRVHQFLWRNQKLLNISCQL